jgi:hypothetical protein
MPWITLQEEKIILKKGEKQNILLMKGVCLCDLIIGIGPARKIDKREKIKFIAKGVSREHSCGTVPLTDQGCDADFRGGVKEKTWRVHSLDLIPTIEEDAEVTIFIITGYENHLSPKANEYVKLIKSFVSLSPGNCKIGHSGYGKIRLDLDAGMYFASPESTGIFKELIHQGLDDISSEEGENNYFVMTQT